LVLVGLAGVLFASPGVTVANAVMHWTAGARKSSKWINLNPAFEAAAPQHDKGNFAVNSGTS
jgi:hypothetical protein